MCGLIGALLAEPAGTDERITSALESIAHRGPDHTGWWCSRDRRMVLGHVRLSVIGLTNGNQPLSTPDGEVQCVVNGELYGYRAVREALRARGRQFVTDSDSEIALHLYAELGERFVHQLRGEFAVVIADQRRRCLIAVRDRFGIKPLFYTVRGGDVLVASEIKALLALGVPARWDGAAFFAECHHVRTADRTLFAGIRAVPPGCLLVARDGQVDIRPYWDTNYPRREILASDGRSEAEIVAGFRQVLEDAVAQRLIADVEVACYLSGGIDSGAVLGLAQRKLSRPIRAFTIVFRDEQYNEEKLARHAADWVGAAFVPVLVSQRQVAEAFADALWHAETLMFNGHGVAKYLLSRAVHNAGIKAVFTGEGSDEILGGYPPFRRDMLLHHTGQEVSGETDALLAELDATNQAWQRQYVAQGPPAPGVEVFTARLGWVPSAIQASSTLAATMYPLFTPDALRAGLRSEPYRTLLDSLDVPGRLVGRDPLNQALYVWMHTLLPTFILTVLGDRMEMAHSVEGRVPFLDHHVAEYAAQIPVSHKIRGLREKDVLREAVRDCVPPEIYERQKHPFLSPPAYESTDALAVFCQDTLRSETLKEQPFFDPVRVRALMDRVAAMHPAERAGRDSVILRIVSTCLLQQRFGLGSG
jgi:asparagine synthase (glutamine-hydrolysing)